MCKSVKEIMEGGVYSPVAEAQQCEWYRGLSYNICLYG
jgi:hypothetical protein